MKVGYARTSTAGQQAGFEAQIRDLIAAGCDENIFQEQTSAVKERDRLEAALEFLRAGDTLVVTKLDRLARSLPELHKILDRITKKGAFLEILGMRIDTATSEGMMMINLMGTFAQFEREIMLERQREGIEQARLKGKFKGRKGLPQEIKDHVLALLETGVTKSWVAKKLKLGEATIYRIINEQKALPSN